MCKLEVFRDVDNKTDHSDRVHRKEWLTVSSVNSAKMGNVIVGEFGQ
jgi:hypothetical protein